MKIRSFFLAALLSLTSFTAFAETVNLNKANAAALQHYLKGIGEKKARDIVEYRTQHNTFKKIEEVMNVKGIGETTFKKIKADLSVNEGVVSVSSKKDKTQKKTITSKKLETKKEITK